MQFVGIASLSTALLVSVGANVFQARRLLQLADLADKDAPMEGLRLPVLHVTDVNNKQMALDLRDRKKTVLYIFSPHCNWCIKNSSALAAFSSQLRTKEYRLLGLSLLDDGLQEFMSAHDIRFPVYTLDQSDALSMSRLRITPHTLVIGPDGTVVREILGGYAGSNKTILERYFSLSLPAEQAGSS